MSSHSLDEQTANGAEEAPAHPSAPAADLPGLAGGSLPEFPVPSSDPRAIADAIRPDSGLALSSTGTVVLLRHAEVVAAAHDAVTFSSGVSRHLQLPNGLDGDEHTAFRRLIDPYFTPDRMAELEPVIREVARELCAELVTGQDDSAGNAPSGAAGAGGSHSAGTGGARRWDAVSDIGARFAVRAQTRWLGWPSSLEPVLLDWMADNQAATRSGRGEDTAEVAHRFDAIIRSVLDPRRAAGAQAPEDVTTELMCDESLGRPLREEELVSILRNWTGGDLGSIALCVGVILQHLVEHPELQERVRSGVSAAELDAIIDEILRIDDPFVANRRITTCPVSVGGVRLPAGQRVVLNWTSANRDELEFGDPNAFDPHGSAESNLVYGTGKHVCPGRPLATMELRVLVEEITSAFSLITPAPDADAQRSVTPVGGYSSVPVLLMPAQDRRSAITCG
ncbi:cytochrome P450 [Brevibacterium daeguense]|uniref:Cytochrome P450 n=1 Tax=Brevibacterium daeguense TaxID=909936 RepID=A0ABP8ELN3_9MICO|nr:cytochrome P450 [Brevibacterium daeguense]